MQPLLQFYSVFFETLQMFRSWSVGVHIVWIYPHFLSLLSQNELKDPFSRIFSNFCGQSDIY